MVYRFVVQIIFVVLVEPNEQTRYEILKIHSSKITKHGEIGELYYLTI